MNDTILLPLECLLSALFSLAVLRVLRRPLSGLLDRLCPDQQAASFWLSYTQLMLALAPLLCVLIIDLLIANGDPYAKLRFGMIASLSGLLGGLWIVGRRLGRFVEAAHGNGAAS